MGLSWCKCMSRAGLQQGKSAPCDINRYDTDIESFVRCCFYYSIKDSFVALLKLYLLELCANCDHSKIDPAQSLESVTSESKTSSADDMGPDFARICLS